MAIAERIPGIAGKIAGRQADTETGALAWVMQRLTAVVVGVFISVHIWLLHFTLQARSGEAASVSSVAGRMASPWYLALDVLLLASLLYHTLNGVRAVLIDWGVGRTSTKGLTRGLFIFGLVLLGYGIWALVPFTVGRSS
ncbi:MAG: hypothetical protein HYX90_02990 [Chloroflexi bacterium]|nr:hypothetical protein [Chloroflexota bacterium]